MSGAPKPIRFRLEPPFDEYEVDVLAIRYSGEAEPRGFSVGVMNRMEGRGHRYSIEYADALASGIKKAIRAHKRRQARTDTAA